MSAAPSLGWSLRGPQANTQGSSKVSSDDTSTGEDDKMKYGEKTMSKHELRVIMSRGCFQAYLRLMREW